MICPGQEFGTWRAEKQPVRRKSRVRDLFLGQIRTGAVRREFVLGKEKEANSCPANLLIFLVELIGVEPTTS
jgi:hypothetical protein